MAIVGSNSLSFSLHRSNPSINQTLPITHIFPEPYSFVRNILYNESISTHLTQVPETDYQQLNEEVFSYFVVALIVIIAIFISFCRGQQQKKEIYSSLPVRSYLQQMEEEHDIDIE